PFGRERLRSCAAFHDLRRGIAGGIYFMLTRTIGRYLDWPVDRLGALLDGPVARRQGRVSLFGAFLDSILDRYADLILFLGLLVYYSHVNRFGYAILAGAAMAGSGVGSYPTAPAALRGR